MALWGGRFSQEADQRFKQFNDSLRFDYRLAQQDIIGSVASVSYTHLTLPTILRV